MAVVVVAVAVVAVVDVVDVVVAFIAATATTTLQGVRRPPRCKSEGLSWQTKNKNRKNLFCLLGRVRLICCFPFEHVLSMLDKELQTLRITDIALKNENETKGTLGINANSGTTNKT